MNDELLYTITLTDAAPGFELASEMLAALELESSSWEDRENRRVLHTAYFQSAAERNAALPRVEEAVKLWSEWGLKITAVTGGEIRREEWSEVWKKYFHEIEVSPTLLIRPTWVKCDPKPGQALVEIDPGMTFGTGHHATTLFCLECIDKLSGKAHSLLDAGCGSGILAVAAVKRGYTTVDAFDYDPDAVDAAKENLALNGIGCVVPEKGDAAVWKSASGRRYDLVCANILGHLLKAYRHNIASWVKPGGHLALAGILNAEFEGLSRTYTDLGFVPVEQKKLKEWTSGLFLKPL